MNDEWYAPNQIKYTKDQMLWLLNHLPDLRLGYWPPNPQGSGYVDMPINKKAVKAKAHFITAVEVAAEIDDRLEQCGLDGLLVEANYTWDKSIDSLVKASSLDFYEVVRRISRALKYISSGYDRRWHTTRKREGVSYTEWISHRRQSSQSKAKCDMKKGT